MSIPFIDMAAMHAEVRCELDSVWEELVSTNCYIGGPAVEQFESAWADYCDTRYCVGVSSGTAALELALRAIGIGPGDEVIVPANTFIATAAAVAVIGAEPVFVDVDPATLLLTADAVRAALTPRTAAVIPVHLYGQPANMDSINRVAAEAGLAVVEDAAQAHGATWNGRKAGGLGTAGCFSFYPGKNLGAFGDAGAVVTNDRALAQKIRALSNHGRCQEMPYQHDLVGTNDRLDAVQAGVLLAKLPRLDDWNAGRASAASLYRKLLCELPVDLPAIAPPAVSANHLFVIQSDQRDQLRNALSRANIGVGMHYPIPCHQQVPFRRTSRGALPVADGAACRLLSLPIYPHLTGNQIDHVVETIRAVLNPASQIELADGMRV